MERILTRKWFWILTTTIVPVLWSVLTATPDQDAAQQAQGAKGLKAALAICARLDPKTCHP